MEKGCSVSIAVNFMKNMRGEVMSENILRYWGLKEYYGQSYIFRLQLTRLKVEAILLEEDRI